VRATLARTLSRKCGVQNEQVLFPYAVGPREAERTKKSEEFLERAQPVLEVSLRAEGSLFVPQSV
jgi:hypothetical protein